MRHVCRVNTIDHQAGQEEFATRILADGTYHANFYIQTCPRRGHRLVANLAASDRLHAVGQQRLVGARHAQSIQG